MPLAPSPSRDTSSSTASDQSAPVGIIRLGASEWLSGVEPKVAVLLEALSPLPFETPLVLRLKSLDAFLMSLIMSRGPGFGAARDSGHILVTSARLLEVGSALNNGPP